MKLTFLDFLLLVRLSAHYEILGVFHIQNSSFFKTLCTARCEVREQLWVQGEAVFQLHNFRNKEPQPVIKTRKKQTINNSLTKQYITRDLSLPKPEELATSVRRPFKHWRVCSCCSTRAEKVGRFCGWTGLAWVQLWVHLESVSVGLALLVLLQIRGKEITVYITLSYTALYWLIQVYMS